MKSIVHVDTKEIVDSGSLYLLNDSRNVLIEYGDTQIEFHITADVTEAQKLRQTMPGIEGNSIIFPGCFVSTQIDLTATLLIQASLHRFGNGTHGPLIFTYTIMRY